MSKELLDPGGSSTGFEVKCKKCGSSDVSVSDDVGYGCSELTGVYGSVGLRCNECDHYADLFSL